jgi:formate-dependent nitrite reductase membrane component NrfD
MQVVRGAVSLGLGVVFPLLVHGYGVVSGRHSRTTTLLAALTTLIGAFAERAVIVLAGGASADRAEDYFRITSPGTGA